MVHVDGIFDGLLCKATEAAGRHAGYVALCHRLTLQSVAGNTPWGQEIEGTTDMSIRGVRDFRFERPEYWGFLFKSFYEAHYTKAPENFYSYIHNLNTGTKYRKVSGRGLLGCDAV